MNKVTRASENLLEMATETIVETESQVQPMTQVNRRWTRILIGLTVLMAVLSVILFYWMIDVGASAYRTSCSEAYDQDRKATYDSIYHKYFDQAEQAYHVSNRVSIRIGELKETANLEVLTVSDVEYVIEESDDNGKGIVSWLEVPGQGIYVVNLQAAEFLVDDERAHVRVRVPNPELTNIAIDYANVKKLLFMNDIFNDDYRVGEDLARKQCETADHLIEKEFASNQNFYLNAQEAAVSTIQCLVKRLNPTRPELTVEVEFF